MNNKTMISEIIDRMGVTRFSMRIFVIIGLVLFFDGLDFMIVSYTMPQIAADWGLSKVMTGSLVSYGMLGLILGGLIIGPTSDKIGRKKSIIIGCLVYSLANLPIYFAPNIEFYAVFRVLSGVGIGAVVSAATTTVSEFAPTKRRGIMTASVYAFYGLGYICAALLGMYVVPAYGWRLCYLLGATPAIYGFIMIKVLPESPYWLASKGRAAEAIQVLNRAERISNRAITSIGPDDLFIPPPPKKVGVRALLTKDFRRMTIALWVLTFFGLMLNYGITTWMPTLLMSKGYGLTKSYTFALMGNLSVVFGSAITGFTADYFGRKKNLIFTYILAIISLVLVGLSQITWAMVTFSIAAQVFVAIGQSGLNPIQAESFPTEFRNTGISWTQGFGRFGGLLIPLIVGGLVQMGIGFSGIFYLFMIPAAINLFVSLFVLRETKGTKADSIGQKTQV